MRIVDAFQIFPGKPVMIGSSGFSWDRLLEKTTIVVR
jgi:hypothetical protein